MSEVAMMKQIASRLNVSLSAQLVRQRQTVDNLKQAIIAAENWLFPNRHQLWQVYQDIEMDAHLSAIIHQRMMMTLSQDFKVVFREEVTTDFDGLFKSQWFADFVKAILESVYYGYSLVQIDGIAYGNITGVTLMQRHLTKPETHEWLAFAGAIKGVDFTQPPYDEWYIGIGRPRDLGLLMKAAIHVLSKRFVFASWDEFTQVFGMPTRVVELDGMAGNSADKEAIINDISETGPAAAIILDKGQKLQLLESVKTDAFAVYKELISYRNQELSKLVLGQTGTTEEKSFVGSAQVHEVVAGYYAQSDMKLVANVVNTQLVPVLVRHKLLPEGVVFGWDNEERLGSSEQIKIDQIISDMGYEIDEGYLKDRYGTQIMGRKGQAVAGQNAGELDDLGKSAASADDAAAGARNLIAYQVKPIYEVLESDCGVGCHHHEVAVSNKSELVTDEELEALLQAIYDGRTSVNRPAHDLYLKTAKKLLEGLDLGVSGSISGQSASRRGYEIDASLRAKLAENVYLFSAAKTVSQVKDLEALLVKEDGQRRLFSEFERVAMPVVGDYNRSYLKAEYEATVASGRMAAYWGQIQEDADEFPNLRYNTVGDANVRPAHAALNGIVCAVDDPFWDVHFPPNGWGCRCTVDQVRGSVPLTAVSKIPEVSERELPKVFRNNPGKSGEVFTAAHPYFQDKGVVETAAGMVEREMEVVLSAKYFIIKEGLEDIRERRKGGVIKELSHLTDLELGCLFAYTEGSGYVNRPLRAGNPSYEALLFIGQLESGIKKGSKWLPKLYRAIGASPELMAELWSCFDDKRPFVDKGFFSTSKNDEVIYGFPASESDQNTIVVFELEYGFGIDLQEISPLQDEYEVLLNRSSKFEIVSMTPHEVKNEIMIRIKQITN